MSWYIGPTLFEALNQLIVRKTRAGMRTRALVTDLKKVDDSGYSALGRIHGSDFTLKGFEKLQIYQGHQKNRGNLTQMKIFNQIVEKAIGGDIVEMYFDLTEEGSLDMGKDAVACHDDEPLKLTECITCQVIVMETEEPFKLDDKFIFYAGG